MIFIEYQNNEYYFICHKQENTIFHSIHAIFDEGIFPKYTNSYAEEHKSYDELLDKTSPEIELLIPNSSGKDGPAPVPIPYTPILLIQNNSPTHLSSPSLSYKFISSLPTPGPKKPIVMNQDSKC